MQSPCGGDTLQPCFHRCCVKPFLGLSDQPQTSKSLTTAAASRHSFEVAMASSIYPNSLFTNHESLPSLHESFANFTQTFPQYSQTDQADRIREQEYYHLSQSNHVCLDYIGHGLFSFAQQQSHNQAAPIASTSSSPPIYSTVLDAPPFFNIIYKSVTLNSQIQFGGHETELENRIKKRVSAFMNIFEDEYTMILMANQSCAFKLLADAYPFESNRKLLTVYDYESEAVNMMIETSKKKGSRVISAEFSWPNLRIHSRNLRKQVVGNNKNKTKKKRKRGLFVFPLQSRMTGRRYSYLWMSLAQENGWHVLFDASALGAKDMETLGLSLFKPDFLICSFFKIFGENPSGFACLFVKKSSAPILMDSTTGTNTGIVKLVPATKTSEISEEFDNVQVKHGLESDNNDILLQGSTSGPVTKNSEQHELEGTDTKQKAPEIEEIEAPSSSNQNISSGGGNTEQELECRGLNHADSLGLILISARARYLINWLLNALMSLRHPHSETGLSPVRIYGPKIKFDRGPAVAFNVFDWKGEKINPELVQKLADRNYISLSVGYLNHIWFSDKYEEERELVLETRTTNGGTTGHEEKDKSSHCRISVVTAAMGLLTNFEDMYRLWAFISRFLDADFVEKERWRYTALNQTMIEI